MAQQLNVGPEAIVKALQEVMAQQQNEIVMLKAAVIQLTTSPEYREGDDPPAYDGLSGENADARGASE